MARPRSAAFDINRETIVRTAARLFAQAGYPGTTMNDIARESLINVERHAQATHVAVEWRSSPTHPSWPKR